MSRRCAAMLVAAVALAAVACGGKAHPTSQVDPDDAIIVFHSEVEDAALWVNGRFVAQLGVLQKGVALSPGTHRIEIRHDDYHTRYIELTVGKRERRTIDVEMAPILP